MQLKKLPTRLSVRRQEPRGLRTIVEKMLMDVMFKIPDIKGKKTFTVTKKIVQGKEKNIEALIKTDSAAIESA